MKLTCNHLRELPALVLLPYQGQSSMNEVNEVYNNTSSHDFPIAYKGLYDLYDDEQAYIYV